MSLGDLAYALIAMNPVGGLLAAIPWGVFERHYPLPVLLLSGPPLAFVQVLVVDLLWDRLDRLAWFRAMLERRRSPRVTRLAQSRGAFLPVFLCVPVFGPWFVMAVMRYAEVPARRVALPILLSLFTQACVVSAACLLVPRWFGHG